MASGEAESAKRSEGEPDVERNGMEERLKKVAEKARRIIAGKEVKWLNEFAH
jgi:hypothetical protein